MPSVSQRFSLLQRLQIKWAYAIFIKHHTVIPFHVNIRLYFNMQFIDPCFPVFNLFFLLPYFYAL